MSGSGPGGDAGPPGGAAADTATGAANGAAGGLREIHDLAAIGPEAARDLVALAGRLRERPEPRALEGKVLALLFLSPSLRTQASFQAAMGRLGGSAFVIAPDRFIHQLEFDPGALMDGSAAENIAEAVPVLASYGDALGVRAFAAQESLEEDLADERFERIRRLCPKPFLNLESAARHPCQALSDWRTLDDLRIPAAGGRLTLSWAQHPRPLPLAVARDTLRMAALRGMEVTVLRPKGFALPAAVMDEARVLAAASGGSVRETAEIGDGMAGTEALYAKSWASPQCYGDAEADRELRSETGDWTVREDWFAGAAPDCRFLHCLPVRRGVVVEAAVLDGPRSAVVRQAENRMWTQMAALHRMLA